MGNEIGTISWNKQHPDFTHELDQLLSKHNLTKSQCNALKYDKQSHLYSVEIAGLSLLYTINPKNKIKAFLYDTKELLDNKGIDSTTKLCHLPC